MKNPSFIRLENTSDAEIYKYPETYNACSWQGYIDKITDKDIKHLQNGKPLMLVINEEYICIIEK